MKRMLICLIAGLSLSPALKAMEEEHHLTITAQVSCRSCPLHSNIREYVLLTHGFRLIGWEEPAKGPLPQQMPSVSISTEITNVKPENNAYLTTIGYSLYDADQQPNAKPILTKTFNRAVSDRNNTASYAEYVVLKDSAEAVEGKSLFISIAIEKKKEERTQ
jgi:hypothetical protein